MNIVRLELGVGYQKIKYPAGELQVRLADDIVAQLANADEVELLARISSADQIMELCLLWDAITEVAAPNARKVLVMPYLPYARADRRFVNGDCFGLQTFAQIILGLSAEIVTLDVHSSVSQTLIAKLVSVSSAPLIEEAVVRFAQKNQSQSITVLLPDEGARKRYRLDDSIKGISVTFLNCSKKRDPATGKLAGFAVPELSDFPHTNGKPCPVLLVDDICDGGGTFLGIADGLKDYGLSLGLYVTHGIFSKGFDALNARFETIYTTDSFRLWEPTAKLQVIPAIPLLMETRELSAPKH